MNLALIILSLASTFYTGKVMIDKKVQTDSEQMARLQPIKDRVISHFSYLKIPRKEKEALLPMLTVLYKIKHPPAGLQDMFDMEYVGSRKAPSFYLISENHSKEEVILLNFQLIEKLGSVGDIVLWESNDKKVDAGEKALQKLLAFFPDSDKQIDGFRKYRRYIRSKDLPFHGMQSAGWDIYVPELSISQLPGVLVQLVSNLKEQIIIRNKGLIDTIEKLRGCKVFAIGGAAHWPSKHAKDLYEKNSIMKKWKQEILTFQTSFQSSIGDHAIATLKDMESFEGRSNLDTVLPFLASTGVFIAASAYWTLSCMSGVCLSNPVLTKYIASIGTAFLAWKFFKPDALKDPDKKIDLSYLNNFCSQKSAKP